MPYIGRGPELGVRSRFIYTATANQTSFTGNDDAGISLAYTDTLYMDVYQNGVLLVPATDYAATTGTSVVLVQGASADDTVELLVFDIFSVADSVSAKDGGSFAGNVGMGGTLSVTGNTTVGGTLGVTGASTLTGSLDVGTSTSGIINLKGGSTTSPQMRFFDGGTARARIGVPTGETYLSLSGSDTLAADVSIASDGKVGIGVTAPSCIFHASAGSSDSGLVDIARFENEGTSVNDGPRIQLTAGTSVRGAGMGALGDSLNSAHLVFHAGGNTERFRIASNGDLTGTDTSISSNSDERLKKDIEDYSYSMGIFKQYKPKSFNWKNPEPHGNKVNQKGFLAQDIKKLDEQWVGEIDLNRDSLDCDLITENSDGKRQVLTSKFGEKDAMYISIIQQLEARLAALEAK